MRCKSSWLLAIAGLVYVLVCAHFGTGLIGASPALGKDGGSGGGSGSAGGGSSSGGGGSSGGSGSSSGDGGSGSGGNGGGSGGSGGGSSGGGGPGSSRGNSSSSGDRSGGDGGGEANGGGGGGPRSHVDQRGGTLELVYPDGFSEEISHGILQLTDPAGRTVIKRAATPADYARFRRRR